MENTTRIGECVENLIAYAKAKLDLPEDDEWYVRNALLDHFNLKEPSALCSSCEDIAPSLEMLVEYGIANGLSRDGDKILYETKLLGMVTPVPSAVTAKFDCIAGTDGVEAACEYLFDQGKANNYIRVADIAKNVKWKHHGKHGDIEVTINLSKPEKDPKQIAAAKNAKTGYPKCMLCPSNVGFAGNAAHPARQTLRTVPITLGGESWHLQFSPYQYYHQHVIALSDEHRPMEVNRGCLLRLLDFVDTFPHYFMGSNAALPIVGGSILTHDHYQGGAKVLPMMSRAAKSVYSVDSHPNVNFYTVDWYNSVVRCEGLSLTDTLNAGEFILNSWKTYSDRSVNIISETDAQHNAITPIARMENGKYVLDMILRNNRTDAEHPYGIYHPTEDLHNIKKEGIGIIEVMGIFILPGRLKIELKDVADILAAPVTPDFAGLSATENPLNKHIGMIAQLTSDYGTGLTQQKADEVITDYVNVCCEKILECTAVFKNDENGVQAFDRFMREGLGARKLAF